jgi:hypothetical protein
MYVNAFTTSNYNIKAYTSSPLGQPTSTSYYSSSIVKSTRTPNTNKTTLTTVSNYHSTDLATLVDDNLHQNPIPLLSLGGGGDNDDSGDGRNNFGRGGGGGDKGNGREDNFHEEGDYNNPIQDLVVLLLSVYTLLLNQTKQKVEAILSNKLIASFVATPFITSSFSGSISSSFPSSSTLATKVLKLSSLSNIASKIQAISMKDFTTWYVSCLETNPLLTKSVTSAVIGIMGDYMAQWIEYKFEDKQVKNISSSTTTDFTTDVLHRGGSTSIASYRPFSKNNFLQSILSIHGNYDLRRGIAIMGDGLFISGPLMHWGYGLFEKILPVHSNLAAITHVIADSLILDTVFVATTLVGTGLMEGLNFHQEIVPQLKNDYIPSMKASCATSVGLAPLEFVCFRYLPVSLRTLAINGVDVVWSGVISFMTHRSRH